MTVLRPLGERVRVAAATVATLLALGVAGGCDSDEGEASPAAESHAGPMRTPTELASDLRAGCERARESDQPLMVEFSADWCRDCRTLDEMKTRQPLSQELERWVIAKVNVGDFNVHEALQEAYGVHAIARWVVVRPRSCMEPPERWKAVIGRTLEPETGRPVTAAALATWLEGVRRAAAR